MPSPRGLAVFRIHQFETMRAGVKPCVHHPRRRRRQIV